MWCPLWRLGRGRAAASSPHEGHDEDRQHPADGGDARAVGASHALGDSDALLTKTASTPIWGRLADLYSKKRLIQFALVVFVAGSLAAGLSQSAGQLIAARAFQGIGVGGLQATLRLPVVHREGVKIDYLGATSIAAGAGLLLLWISFAWTSRQSAAMRGGAVALLSLTGWVETRAAEPVIPLGIVRQGTTALAVVGSLAAGTAMYGAAVSWPSTSSSDGATPLPSPDC